jgi:hypothetical protein
MGPGWIIECDTIHLYTLGPQKIILPTHIVPVSNWFYLAPLMVVGHFYGAIQLLRWGIGSFMLLVQIIYVHKKSAGKILLYSYNHFNF